MRICLRRLMLFASAASVLGAASGANARVFSYKDSGLAAYVRGTGFMSSVGDEPFGDSSGSNTSLDAETHYGYSGEFGVLIGLADAFMMRLGAEIIQHHPVTDKSGFRPNGTTKRFELDSTVFVFNPNVTFEYYYATMGSWRFYGSVGAGMSQVTVENDYRMTATGTADLGVGDFVEKMEGSGISYVVATGFETLFTDNATLTMDLGYRHLPIDELKFKGDVNNIVNPTGEAKGDVATTQDGGQRGLNLGGVFVGVAFRFYLNFM